MSTSSQNNQLIFSGAVFRSVILRKVNTPESESPTTKSSLIKFPDKTNVYFYFSKYSKDNDITTRPSKD